MISLVCGSTQSYLSVRDRCREANTTKATLVQGTDACCCLSFYLLGGEWAGRRGGLTDIWKKILLYHGIWKHDQIRQAHHQHFQPVLHVPGIGNSNVCTGNRLLAVRDEWAPGFNSTSVSY